MGGVLDLEGALEIILSACFVPDVGNRDDLNNDPWPGGGVSLSED